jgi:hypothetical protein
MQIKAILEELPSVIDVDVPEVRIVSFVFEPETLIP